MSTQKELNELKELVASKPIEFQKATQGVKQALETVELNNQWKINNYMEFSRRLNRMLQRNFNLDEADFDSDEAEDEAEEMLPKAIWYFIF